MNPTAEEILRAMRVRQVGDLIAAHAKGLDPQRLALAIVALTPDGDLGEADLITATLRARGAARFQRIATADIFAPLPPTRWLCEGLQWCPGRPAMLAGYGFSGKTLAAQSAALSIAAGRSIWGWYRPARTGRVLHLDHEQGRHATLKRYQRLAVGLDIEAGDLGDRLVVVVHPPVYLNTPGAFDVYARECEGFDLVVIDALRGATPGVDENDSKIRACIDVLCRVSEKAGAAFLLIHHAGKPNEGHTDPRTVLRGSSAIFDACGSVLALIGEKSEDGGNLPKRVVHAKGAAEAEGGSVEPFYIAIEDVPQEGNPSAGVRVVTRTVEQVKPPTKAGADLDKAQAKVLAYIGRENAAGRGVAGKSVAAKRAGANYSTALAAVGELLAQGVIVDRPEMVGGKPAPRLWVVDGVPEHAPAPVDEK